MKNRACKRFWAAFLTVLLLCVGGLIPAVGASGPVGLITDDAELLSEQERNRLTSHTVDLTNRVRVEFYLATYRAQGRWDDYTGDDFCREKLDLRSKDAVLLIVTYDELDGKYYYDLYTYGRANTAITGTEVDYMLDDDDVYYNLKRGHLYAGAEAFFSLAATAYKGRLGVSYAVIIPVCAVIGILVGVGVCYGVAASYKQRSPSVDYPLDRYAKLELTAGADTPKGTTVSRTYVPRNRSGGGGGRSAHGGGGGHRGGR